MVLLAGLEVLELENVEKFLFRALLEGALILLLKQKQA